MEDFAEFGFFTSQSQVRTLRVKPLLGLTHEEMLTMFSYDGFQGLNTHQSSDYY